MDFLFHTQFFHVILVTVLLWRIAMGSDKKTANKTLYFEILRIMAVFAVIFIHTGDTGYSLFTLRKFGSLDYWVDLAISIFSRFCVATFFAISGALLLPKNESLKKVWKRVLRMFIILVAVSLLYWFEFLHNNGGKFSLIAFFHKFYYDQTRYHLWFVYSYIAFLITLPVLRALAQNLEDKYFYYMIALEIFFKGIIPVLDYRLTVYEFPMNPNLIPSWMFEQIFFFPLVGYFLHNRLDAEQEKKYVLPLWIADIAAIAVSCYMTWFQTRLIGFGAEDPTPNFHFCFISVNCITLFVTARVLFKDGRLPAWLERVLKEVGSCVFGIYLFHMYFLRQPWIEGILRSLVDSGCDKMVAVHIEILCIFLVSLVPSWILKHIPYIRDLL